MSKFLNISFETYFAKKYVYEIGEKLIFQREFFHDIIMRKSGDRANCCEKRKKLSYSVQCERVLFPPKCCVLKNTA